MTVEGIPFTAIPMTSETRPVVTAAFLSSGDHAFFQAVILPSYLGGGLSSDELDAVRAFEAKFGVREVDAFNYANPAVGLNVASVAGDIAGTTATVTRRREERRLSISQRPRAVRPRELLLPRHSTLGDVRTADAPRRDVHDDVVGTDSRIRPHLAP